MKISTLERVPVAEIVDVYNEAFSDYYFPISLSIDGFQTKMDTENGRLDLSVGAFDNDKLIGFIIHFSDGKLLYNGGTGVIPNYRGKKIVQKMYEFILDLCRNTGIEKSVLEVLEINTRAIKSYQKQGFQIVRKLDCFKGKIVLTQINSNLESRQLENDNWELYPSFWDVTPTWQNSLSTLRKLKGQTKSFGVFDNQNLVGYIIYNPNTKRIHQLAVDKKYRRKSVGTILLNEIHQLEKGEVSLINIDTHSKGFRPFLEKRGLQFYTQQYEMLLDLTE